MVTPLLFLVASPMSLWFLCWLSTESSISMFTTTTTGALKLPPFCTKLLMLCHKHLQWKTIMLPNVHWMSFWPYQSLWSSPCHSKSILLTNAKPSNQCSAVQGHYKAVNFLQNIYERHLIAHPIGWGVGFLFKAQPLINILPQFLQWFV